MNYNEHVECWKCICNLPLNALRNYASVYACMFGIPVMYHVNFLISALIYPFLCSWGYLPVWIEVLVASSSPVGGSGMWHWRCWVIFEIFCLLSSLSFVMTCLKWLTRSSSIHYIVSVDLPSISLSLWIFDRCMFWITKLLNNFLLQSHSWSHWFLDHWFLYISSFLYFKDI